MTTFLILLLIAGAIVGFGGALIVGAIWLVTFPIRLFFKLLFGVIGLAFSLLGSVLGLVFGILGALLGVLAIPIVLLIAGVAVIGGLITAVVSLLAPLLPFVLLAGLVWALFRLFGHRQPSVG